MSQRTFLRLMAYTCLISISGFTQELPENYLIVFRHGSRADAAFWNHINDIATSHEKPHSPVLSPDEVEALRQTEQSDFRQLRRSFWESFMNVRGWNAHNIGLWHDQSDAHLDESARDLARLGTRPDIIISSPYLRSIQTAEIIQEAFANEAAHQIQIVIDDRLGEWPYAAFGRAGSPIIPVLQEGYENITPEGWNPEVLNNEMTEISRPIHLERIRGVLHEHHRAYPRALIVGHLDTVAAAYPVLARDRLSNIEQGGHVIASSSEYITDRFRELTVYHRYSRRVIWQDPPTIPCNCENQTQTQ